MSEIDKPTRYEQRRDQAVEMAFWFEDYLFGTRDDIEVLPDSTVDRLKRQFGDGDRAAQLEQFKDYLVALDPAYQPIFALYICGYSAEDIASLSGSNVDVMIAKLDSDIPANALRKKQATASFHDRFEWQEDAKCRGMDSNMFFPIDNMRGARLREFEARAKEVCSGCSVQDSCKRHALQTREPYGVWGGLGLSERQEILRQGKSEAS